MNTAPKQTKLDSTTASMHGFQCRCHDCAGGRGVPRPFKTTAAPTHGSMPLQRLCRWPGCPAAIDGV
eukprot:3577726-Lingulodinium_polyedra.AAC.1